MWKKKYAFNGTAVKVAVLKQGLNLQEIAEDFGVPYSTLLRWVNGRSVPPVHFAFYLENRLGLSLKDLVNEVSQVGNSPKSGSRN